MTLEINRMALGATCLARSGRPPLAKEDDRKKDGPIWSWAGSTTYQVHLCRLMDAGKPQSMTQFIYVMKILEFSSMLRCLITSKTSFSPYKAIRNLTRRILFVAMFCSMWWRHVISRFMMCDKWRWHLFKPRRVDFVPEISICIKSSSLMKRTNLRRPYSLSADT